MPRSVLPVLLAAACACALPAQASTAEPASCHAPAAGGSELLRDRSGHLARLQQLPRECLQDIFRQCSQAAGATLLDFGSAAACSLGYEALLHAHYDGDFQALMAWWRAEAGRPRG